jgi:hypothetical protein
VKTQFIRQTESTTQPLAEKALEHTSPWAAFQKIGGIAVLLLAAWALTTGTSHGAVVAGSAIALYALGFITLSLSRSSR